MARLQEQQGARGEARSDITARLRCLRCNALGHLRGAAPAAPHAAVFADLRRAVGDLSSARPRRSTAAAHAGGAGWGRWLGAL
jgi:hypothetical protein